jgi:L-aspartate oxidase
MITETAPEIIKQLDLLGVQFERAGCDYALSREACHSVKRVLRAKAGDGFGRALMAGLIDAVRKTPSVNVFYPYTAERLSKDKQNNINGVYLRHVVTGEMILYRAKAVIMATGGIGGLYDVTTNPLSSTGRGVAISAMAGAELSDLEFVQFHPTALDIGIDPAPLATEALRGEGARLINDRGEYFMTEDHPMAELAPRDVVSRSIFRQLQKGHTVYLDCTKIDTGHFPALRNACLSVGIDPQETPVPVRPATHYHMGGIATDMNGRTSINGLWAAGECAATGLHGANRLASNSLMEAVIMGQRAALDIKQSFDAFTPVSEAPEYPHTGRLVDDERAIYKKHIRRVMSECVGVVRCAGELNDAMDLFLEIMDALYDKDLELYDMALMGYMIVQNALNRTESRGGHCRSDYPDARDEWAHRSYYTYIPDRVRTPKILEEAV